MQTDTLLNHQLTNQLLELQTVIDNPCEAYYKKRPPPRQRTAKQRQNNEPLPPRETFDDGFIEIAQGIHEVEKWIKSRDWLQLLKAKLTQTDFDNFVGQTFQHRLAHRYLRKTDRTFRLKVCKTNPYCLKLENMKSKYTSATFRSPILNFRFLFAELFPRQVLPESVDDPQVEWWKNKEQEYKSENTEEIEIQQPNSQNGDIQMKIYKRKSWKELDWSVWKSKLIKVQYFGTCNAGQQMPNPCAHVSAFFYLIWWSLTNKLQDKLKVPAKDAKLLDKRTGPVNLNMCVEYLKGLKNHYIKNNIALYCICQKPAQGTLFTQRKHIFVTIHSLFCRSIFWTMSLL